MRIVFCLLITSQLIAQQKNIMRADFAQDEQFISWFYKKYHNKKQHKHDFFSQRKPKRKTKRQIRIEQREAGYLADTNE